MLIEKTDLSIGLTVNLDLTGYSSLVVNYVSPTGEGTIVPTVRDAAAGSVLVALPPALNREDGTWRMWLTVVLGGKTSKSSAITFTVAPEGTPA